MSLNITAKNNYNKNDLLRNYNVYDFFLFTNTKTKSNVSLILDNNNNKYYLKATRNIKKGDCLSLNIVDLQTGGSYIKNKSNSNLVKEFNEFTKLGYKLLNFINCQNFGKNNIKNIKNELNKSNLLKKNPLNNKFIYKIIKKSYTQEGGVYNYEDGMTNKIERLPQVEVGPFYNQPQAITFTQKINTLHLILDLIGIIPFYGLAADTVNFLLYFIRGEYGDAFYSLICMIPTIGSILGLTAKYTEKFIFNRNPEYRKYYDSLRSLKDITTELRLIEDKNLNLDDQAYINNDEEYEP